MGAEYILGWNSVGGSSLPQQLDGILDCPQCDGEASPR